MIFFINLKLIPQQGVFREPRLTAIFGVVVQVAVSVGREVVCALIGRLAGTALGENIARRQHQRGAEHREAEGTVALSLHEQTLG